MTDPVKEARELLAKWAKMLERSGGWGPYPTHIRTILSTLEATEAERDAARAREKVKDAALKASREGLSIAAGWASRKPDSQNARDKIKGALDAIRTALRLTPGDQP